MERIALGWLVVLATLSAFNVLWSASAQKQMAAHRQEVHAWQKQPNRPATPPRPRITPEKVVAQAALSVAVVLFIWGALSTFAPRRAAVISAVLTWLLAVAPMLFILARASTAAAALGYLAVLLAAAVIAWHLGRRSAPSIKARLQPAAD